MKRETLKTTLPAEKFKEMMRIAYIDDMPPSLNDYANSENVVHEEGLNEMIIGLFGGGTMMMIMIIWLMVMMIAGVITTNVILMKTT